MEIPEHIKFLIAKWTKGRLSKEDQEILDTWYNEHLPPKIYLEGEEHTVRQTLFRRIEAELGEEVIPKVRRFPVWSKVAAVILAFGASIFLYRYIIQPSVPQSTQLVENLQGVRKIILPDSSIVWVKANSRFSFPEQFGSNIREVNLDGEALFEVAADKNRPFIVRSGHYLAKVLGTSFNLRTGERAEDFNLSVLTGKVQVERKEPQLGSKTFLVSANQEFHGRNEEVLTRSTVDEQMKLQELTAGTEYDMAFVNAPMEEIMDRFEKKFNIRFEGYTGEYKSCKITANLTGQSLEKSLKIICLSINADYKIDNNVIYLTGGGCF